MIESDTGFSVEQIDVGTLVYREDNRSVKIGFQPLTGPYQMLIYLGFADHWEPPSNQKGIAEDDWSRMEQNIREAYRSQKVAVVFRYPLPGEKEVLKKYVYKDATEGAGNSHPLLP
ncbi:MAG: hypothetical protein ACYTE3_16805 [Planctomycetota bacterium]